MPLGYEKWSTLWKKVSEEGGVTGVSAGKWNEHHQSGERGKELGTGVTTHKARKVEKEFVREPVTNQVRRRNELPPVYSRRQKGKIRG